MSNDYALKVLAIKWTIENGLLPAETKWGSGKIIESIGKKLYWN